MTKYERNETHILTTDPELVEVKLKRLKRQGWIIHSIETVPSEGPGDPGRTVLDSDVPMERIRHT